MTDVQDLKPGDPLKFSAFWWANKNNVKGDKWGILLGDETGHDPMFRDGLIFSRDSDGKWHSFVAPIGGDDQFVVAAPEDVPDDIPDDFWPTVARYKMLGEDA